MKTGYFVGAALLLGAVAFGQGNSKVLAFLELPGSPPSPIELVSVGDNNGFSTEPGFPTAQKRAGKAKYKNIVLKRGFVNDASLLEWFNGAMAGKTDRKSGSVIYLDRAGAEVLRYNFYEGWPCSITFPELDASSSEPAEMTFTVCSPAGGSPPEPLGAIRAVGKHKGDYLPAHNFKLEIDGIISGSIRVAPVTVSFAEPGMRFADDPDDTSHVRVSSLEFDCPISEAPYYNEWRKLLDRGQAGDGALRTIRVVTVSNEGEPLTITYPACAPYSMERRIGRTGQDIMTVRCYVNGQPYVHR